MVELARATALAAIRPLGLFVLGLAIGLYRIGAKSLWRDEVTTVVYARLDLQTMLTSVGKNDANGIAYYTLANLWGHLVGFGEGVMRAPSAVFAALAVALFYVLARRYLTAARAFAAGALLAGSQIFVLYAQDARPYGLALLLTVATSELLLRALDGRRGAWPLYVVAAGVGVYVHLWIGLVVVTHGVYLLAIRRFGRPAILSFTVIGLLAVPQAHYALTHTAGTAWVPPMTTETLSLTLLGLAGGSWLLLIVTGEALLALAWLVYRGRRDLLFPLLWASVPIVLTIGISFVHSMLVTRYLIVVLPAMALVLVLAVSVLRARPAVAACLALLLIVSASTGLSAYARPNEDYRAAAATVMRAAAGSDELVVLPAGIRVGLDYYATRLHGQLPRIVTVNDAVASRPSVVWVVCRNDGSLAPVRKSLEAGGYAIRLSTRLEGFTVQRYEIVRSALEAAPDLDPWGMLWKLLAILESLRGG